MAVHRVAFSRPVLAAVQQGSITCTLRTGLVATPGDVLLAGLPGQPPLLRLKVTGFRRQVPLQELTRRELARAGIRDAHTRTAALTEAGDLRDGAWRAPNRSAPGDADARAESGGAYASRPAGPGANPVVNVIHFRLMKR